MTRTRTIALAAALAASTVASGAALAATGDDRPGPTVETAAAGRDDDTTRTERQLPASSTTSTTDGAAAGDDAEAAVDAPAEGAVEAPTDTAGATGEADAVDSSATTGTDAPAGTAAPTAPAAPAAAVHEVLAGGGSTPPATPEAPIGALDLGDRPDGLVAPSGGQAGAGGHAGPGGKAVAPSCSHRCITKGVAHPRGFGAELLVETSVPAELFLAAVADLDGNGTFETSYHDWSDPGVTQHTWALDHLEPGTTYHVTVAATDADGHTDHAWGEFTTLSQRTVWVELGDATITGGPSGVTSTSWHLGFEGVEGPRQDVTPGQQGILVFPDLPRHIDLALTLARSWDGAKGNTPCEVWGASGMQGHSNCTAWNTAWLDDVDLEAVPNGVGHWTQTSIAAVLHTPTDAGGALPPGYGDPYWFDIATTVTFHVTYS